MNPIAEQAIKALTAPGYPTANNHCQQFARLVVQAVPEVAHKYDAWLWKDTAKLAAFALETLDFGYKRSEMPVLQPGDLLYKTNGTSGHVGIYIGDNKAAENSTVHWNATGGKDARGIRTLADFGHIDIVVRFPVAVKAEAKPLPQIPVPTYDGPGFDIVVLKPNGDAQNIGPGLIYGGDVYGPLRAFVNQYDLDIVKTGDYRARKEQPAFYVMAGALKK